MGNQTTVANLRADAQRNRDALLAAAKEVFAEAGPEAPLSEIARRAGVGQGTLYRRFPTREALIATVIDVMLAELRELAERVDNEPDALIAVLSGAVALNREHQSWIEVRARFPPAEEVMRRQRAAVIEILEAPLRRSQQAGLIRDDITVQDVRLLLSMIGSACRHGDDEQDYARALELVLDAIRAR